MRGLKAAGANAGLDELGLIDRDGLGRTRDDDELRRIHGRDRHAGGQRRQVSDRDCDRQHRAGLHFTHQPATQRHETEGLRQRQDARPAGCRVVADAVADHQVGADPPGLQQFRQGVVHDEERHLGGFGSLQRRRVLGRSRSRREHQVAQLGGGLGRDERETVIDGRREDGFVAIEVDAHAGILRTLAGEHESDLGRVLRQLPRDAARAVAGRERFRGAGGIGRDDDPSMVEGPPTDLGRESHIGEGGSVTPSEIRLETTRDRGQHRLGPRR